MEMSRSTGEHEGVDHRGIHFGGWLNNLYSGCWTMEVARDAERVRAGLLAPCSSRGFEQPIYSSPRHQRPLAADHVVRANRYSHCLFEYFRIDGRCQV